MIWWPFVQPVRQASAMPNINPFPLDRTMFS